MPQHQLSARPWDDRTDAARPAAAANTSQTNRLGASHFATDQDNEIESIVRIRQTPGVQVTSFAGSPLSGITQWMTSIRQSPCQTSFCVRSVLRRADSHRPATRQSLPARHAAHQHHSSTANPCQNRTSNQKARDSPRVPGIALCEQRMRRLRHGAARGRNCTTDISAEVVTHHVDQQFCCRTTVSVCSG